MPSRQDPRNGVRRTVVLIGVADVAVIGLVCALVGPSASPAGHPAAIVAFSALFGLVGALRMRLYFSEQHVDFVLTDAVLVAGLFYLGAPWLGLAACVGELLYCLAARKSALKTLFNASTHGAAATLAGAVFLALGGSTAKPSSWLPALAAVLCWGFVEAISVSAVVARAEGYPFDETLVRALPTALATTVLAGSIGLLTVQLLKVGAFYPLLVAPLALAGWLNNRYATTQRDEHLRVERLYRATAQAAQAPTGLDVLAVVADEARRLLTGDSAICCAADAEGNWECRTARPSGVGPGRAKDLQALLGYAARREGGALTTPIPALFQRMVPNAETMVLARSPEGSPADLLVAVFRQRADSNSADVGLGETLAAFVSHGAAIVANAHLLSRVQNSLESQREANKRKDEFVATISHELRTPLTVMLGAAQTPGLRTWKMQFMKCLDGP